MKNMTALQLDRTQKALGFLLDMMRQTIEGNGYLFLALPPVAFQALFDATTRIHGGLSDPGVRVTDQVTTQVRALLKIIVEYIDEGFAFPPEMGEEVKNVRGLFQLILD